MNEWICRLFIKDSNETNSSSVREKHGVLSSFVGIFVNLLLTAGKLTVGILSGSVAAIADAMNNISDAGSSAISFVTFRMASKPADRDHPFGHARIEYIASMIVSFLIMLMGFELFSDALGRLVTPHVETTVSITWVTVTVLALSVLCKLWLAFFYRYIANKIQSSVVKAASVDSLSDCVSTGAILVSSVVIYYTEWYVLDAILGLIVSVLIFFAGVRILNETKNTLLGEAPVNETVEKIEQIVARFPEAIGIHDLLVHNYGPHTSVASLHVEVDGAGNIYELHDAIDNIERTIGTELGILCTVHMDPIETHDETVNELRRFVAETVREVDPSLSVHDFRTVIGTTHTNLIFDVILPFESEETPDSISKKIREAVLQKRENHFCVITVDRG